jgi:hypothetical protein
VTAPVARRRSRTWVGCAIAGLALGGCSVTVVHGSHPAAAPAADGAPADTLRGTVQVTGAEPLTRLVLSTADGAVDLDGPAADPLRQLRGVEVAVEGRREDGRFVADAFRVRGLDGVPAADGRLELLEGRAVLIGPDGARTAFGIAPEALRAHRGRRVWIAGPAGTEPEAWGLIEEP